ncbi:MAG: RNase H family protein, partial [Methylophilaceae bacterium]
WKKLDEYSASLLISWHWVKGHSGDIFNDQVDQMANDATNGILIT